MGPASRAGKNWSFILIVLFVCSFIFLQPFMAPEVSDRNNQDYIQVDNFAYYESDQVKLSSPRNYTKNIELGIHEQNVISKTSDFSKLSQEAVVNQISRIASRIPHPVIRIVQDSDFTSQGWPGTGTPIDPFRIANLSIDASHTPENGIEIRNTQAYFLIQNCVIQTANPWSSIYLFNVKNGLIHNNTILGTEVSFCIKLVGANNNTLTNNTLTAGAYGIHLTEFSTFNNISCNTIETSMYGIYLDQSSFNTIVGNFRNSPVYTAIYLSYADSNLIQENQIICSRTYRDLTYGVRIAHSQNNIIHANQFIRNVYSVYLYHSDYNNISANQYNVSYSGTYIHYSNNNTILNNYYYESGCVLYFGCKDNWILNNSISNIDYGFSLWCFERNYVINNSFFYCGFTIGPTYPYGWGLIETPGLICSGNTINERPACILVNQVGSTLPLDCAQVILIGCEFITIQNYSFESCTCGIGLVNCRNIQIKNNTFQSFPDYPLSFGINLIYTNSCHIFNNWFQNNVEAICCYSSYDTIIENNHVDWTENGIWLTYGNATIRDNVIDTYYSSLEGVILDYIVVENNTIHSQNNNGITIYDSHVIDIQNNFCNLCGWSGIEISTYYSNTLIVVINNTCSRNEKEGILIYCGSNCDCSLVGNRCEKNSEGIALYGWIAFGVMAVRENHCNHNQHNGIKIFQQGFGSIMSNNCSGNGENGIFLSYVFQTNISFNVCQFNQENGISLSVGSDNNIFANQILDNFDIGINLKGVSFTEIVQNYIRNNTFGLILDRTVNMSLVEANEFHDSLSYNAWDDGSENLFYENFWSDYIGVDLNLDGFGDQPYPIPGRAGNQDLRPRISIQGIPSSLLLLVGFSVLLVITFILIIAAIFWIYQRLTKETSQFSQKFHST